MTKVQLVKPHTHAGITYDADDVIEVTETEAKWLARHDVIQQNNRKTRWLKSVPDANTTPNEDH